MRFNFLQSRRKALRLPYLRLRSFSINPVYAEFTPLIVTEAKCCLLLYFTERIILRGIGSSLLHEIGAITGIDDLIFPGSIN
jgi:hypothetical protein